jgi:hypothetical protein
MIYPKRILLMTAFSLLSVLSAQAADIQITALPFGINTPGTYVLDSDFIFTDPTRPAISVNGFLLTGPVIVNLKGHTLLGPGNPQPTSYGGVASTPNSGIGFAVVGDKNNNIPVTLENGTVQGFGIGIIIEAKFVYRNLIVKNMTVFGAYAQDGNGVNGYGACVLLHKAGACSIVDCTFNSADNGIIDSESGGNRYTNDSFIYMTTDITLQNSQGTMKDFNYAGVED